MSDDEVQHVLLRAASEKLSPSLVLSQILEILFRRRMQPLDPDYVTPQGCAELLAKHPDIEALVKEAITLQNSSTMVSSGVLIPRRLRHLAHNIA